MSAPECKATCRQSWEFDPTTLELNEECPAGFCLIELDAQVAAIQDRARPGER